MVKENLLPEKDALAVPLDAEDANRLNAGQLGMWIFISTEIMLFCGIIAAYLVLRLTTLQSGWPTREDMHVSILAGILNTLILIFSGVAAWNGWSAAHENRPRAARLWLLAAIGLGLVFLGIKSWEYYGKYEVGLLPLPHEKQIHEIADYQYLTHVNQRLQRAITDLESRADDSISPEDADRLELLYGLKQHMAEATTRNAGRASSPYDGQLCMNLMAHQIYPHPDTGRNVEEVYVPELQRLNRELGLGRERLTLIQRRQILVQQQVARLQEEVKQAELLGGTEADLAETESRKNWLTTKQQQDQELEVETRRLQSLINPLQGRLDNLEDSFTQEKFEGINERFDVRLPVVVPNGQAWISSYLLLTGTHAFHLIVGLLALLWWLPRKLTSANSAALYVTCMYWQFVDAVWLVIFWIIYF